MAQLRCPICDTSFVAGPAIRKCGDCNKPAVCPSCHECARCWYVQREKVSRRVAQAEKGMSVIL